MAEIESSADAATVLAAADAAESANDHRRVIALLSELRDSPHLDRAELPRVIWLLAEAHYGLGEFADARDYYEEARNAGDADIAASATSRLQILANELQAIDDVADAEVEGNPEIIRVLDAATYAWSDGRFEEALDLFTQAYRSDDLWVSAAAQAGFGIARSLAALGRWTEAKQYTDYLRTTAVGTESYAGVTDLADTVDRQVAALEAAGDGVSGGEITDIMLAANAAFANRDFSGASDHFWRVYDNPVTDGQTRAECAFRIGECYLQMNDYALARSWFTEATQASNSGFANDARQRLSQLDQLEAGSRFVDDEP